MKLEKIIELLDDSKEKSLVDVRKKMLSIGNLSANRKKKLLSFFPEEEILDNNPIILLLKKLPTKYLENFLDNNNADDVNEFVIGLGRLRSNLMALQLKELEDRESSLNESLIALRKNKNPLKFVKDIIGKAEKDLKKLREEKAIFEEEYKKSDMEWLLSVLESESRLLFYGDERYTVFLDLKLYHNILELCSNLREATDVQSRENLERFLTLLINLTSHKENLQTLIDSFYQIHTRNLESLLYFDYGILNLTLLVIGKNSQNADDTNYIIDLFNEIRLGSFPEPSQDSVEYQRFSNVIKSLVDVLRDNKYSTDRSDEDQTYMIAKYIILSFGKEKIKEFLGKEGYDNFLDKFFGKIDSAQESSLIGDKNHIVLNGTFGFEIECILPKEIANLMLSIGNKNNLELRSNIFPSTQAQEGYRVVGDISVQADNTNTHRDIEFPSPVLRVVDDLGIIEPLCATLAEFEAYVNDSTGCHIHSGIVNGYSAEQQLQIIKQVLINFISIDKELTFPKRQYKMADYDEIFSDLGGVDKGLERIIAAENVDQLMTLIKNSPNDDGGEVGRVFSKVNLRSLATNSTIEFRLFPGSVKAQDIMSYILFVNNLVGKSVQMGLSEEGVHLPSKKEKEELLEFVEELRKTNTKILPENKVSQASSQNFSAGNGNFI